MTGFFITLRNGAKKQSKKSTSQLKRPLILLLASLLLITLIGYILFALPATAFDEKVE